MNNTIKTFYYKNNRLQQLRGFCYAAQFGNISRAAKHMGLTRSSVSLQIKALEEDLKIELFHRQGPRLTLTQEGEKLFDLALPHVDGIQNLQEEFDRELRSAKRTELHIAANSTMKNYVLPPIIKDYVDTYPDIYITLHFAEHDEAVKLIQSGAVDLAALPRREHKPFPKFCEYTPIFFHKPCLLTRHDHPLAGRKKLSVREISRYEVALADPDLCVLPNLHEIFPHNDIRKRLRINFVNGESGREYIEAGIVVTIGSDIWIQENDTLVATPLTHLFPYADYGFVKKRNKPMSDKVRKFFDVALRHAAKKKAVKN